LADAGVLEDGTPALSRLREFISKCMAAGVELSAVVLIGSRAEGRWKPWSDVDAVVVVANSSDIGEAVNLAIEAGLDPRVYTPEELLQEAARGDLAALDALEQGKAVYGAEAFSELRQKFTMVKRRLKLRRIEGGWVIGVIEERTLASKSGS